MTSDAILRTYGDTSAREDVVRDALEILTAKETQIFNMLGKTVAINTIHAYLTDTLKYVIGVLKSLLIDLEAVMLTGANPLRDAERLSEVNPLLSGYAIV